MPNETTPDDPNRLTAPPERTVLREAEHALKGALASMHADLDSLGRLQRGRVALEYALQLTFGQGAHPFTLRVKVWPSTDVAPGKYRFAMSHYACTPEQLKGQPYKPGKDQAGSVPEALHDAMHAFMWAIDKAVQKAPFDRAWIVPNPSYTEMPDFKD